MIAQHNSDTIVRCGNHREQHNYERDQYEIQMHSWSIFISIGYGRCEHWRGVEFEGWTTRVDLS